MSGLVTLPGLHLIKPAGLADAPGGDDDWYGNLLRIDGRKCLLRAAGLRATGQFVTGLIEREIQREELPSETFGDLNPATVAVAKTASRTVLGCMNDQAFAVEHSVSLDGGLAHADTADLNQWLRRRILGPLGSTYPIELARERRAGHASGPPPSTASGSRAGPLGIGGSRGERCEQRLPCSGSTSRAFATRGRASSGADPNHGDGGSSSAAASIETRIYTERHYLLAFSYRVGVRWPVPGAGGNDLRRRHFVNAIRNVRVPLVSLDKPSGSDKPDRPDQRLDANRERPFPGAPLDRPTVSPPENARSWEEIKQDKARFASQKEYEAHLRTLSPPGQREAYEFGRKPGFSGTDKIEATESTGEKTGTPETDHQPEATDPTDTSAERIEELETELRETRSELADEKADRRKLTGVVADLTEENRHLKAQLEAKDKSAEVQTEVGDSPNTVTEDSRDTRQDNFDRSWYKKVPVPSEKITGLFTASAGVLESVGVATHSMSGSTEAIVGSMIGLGVAGIAVVRDKRKEQEEKKNNEH